MCGMASTDGSMSVRARRCWPSGSALPQLTLASKVETQGDQVRIQRDGDTATEVIGGTMPLVLSVTDQSGEARYPSFKGIMAAKKKPLETLSLSDLGVDAGDVGLSVAWTEVEETTARPPREAGEIVTDEDGSGAKALADFLAVQEVHLRRAGSWTHDRDPGPRRPRRRRGRKKPTYELLTLAARLGEPSAVFIGPRGQGAEVAEAVKKYGAAKVYVVDDAGSRASWWRPRPRRCSSWSRRPRPARC